MASSKASQVLDPDVLASLQCAAQALRKADALLICTGAGMGVDSGLGTFRGRNAGVWAPLRALQMDFSEMSCPSWFEEDPRLAWLSGIFDTRLTQRALPMLVMIF